MLRKLLKFFTGRLFISFVLISLQIGILVNIFSFAQNSALWIQFLSALSILMTLVVISRDLNPAYKIGWMLIFMSIPVYGGIFYLFFGNRRLNARLRSRLEQLNIFYQKGVEGGAYSELLPMKALASYSPTLARQAQYIANITGFPVWGNTEVEYFSSGEAWVLDVLSEMKKAKSFIFMEFFIISEGEIWDSFLAVLLEKQKMGVRICLMYDDVGSILDIPSHLDRRLRSLGLEVVAFNPLRAHLNSKLNSRDHRKVLVIDGNIGYTGGMNIADEYANRKLKFGHWKDTAVKLRGDAVWSLSQMFLQLWAFSTGKFEDFAKHRPTITTKMDGFVQPFADNPLDNENVAENAYIQIINMAKRYVWITTPYLVLDNEMLTALKIASQSGVDVRIITPHMPDKWYVFAVTRENYRLLLEAGVKIYEYTPGFLHAKMFVSDDRVAIIGTINMDYRSFYLHFENGVAFYGSSVIRKVYEDIQHTLQISERIAQDFHKKRPWYKRLLGLILKIAAPLM
ncbi:cardiolipin synthase [Sphaerochaeta globosa]|uniref:Cardiolipin synthase n=1 Tax=Sphaerochaeta globosa (strain ATCC BAA-1886 / DSM 22777 / Buddy) TaxID=158189 RepID=F0RYF8_SPHGB|nr:cardiolipin synthase [Sphaerochaeta globosa]ADY12729.1 phospholipase D/Transphosphatidylase [Sphaerochaeta globosa str. Buddy]